MMSLKYWAENILYFIFVITIILSKKSMFYKYINRFKFIYHKIIKLKYSNAFILEIKHL